MELVVSIVVLGVLSIVTYGVIALNANTFKTVQDNTVKRWDARKTMQMLEKDIQMINPDKISSMPATNDPVNYLYFTNDDGKLVQYLLNAGALKRKEGSGAWSVILDNVDTNPFQFLDQSSNPTHTKADIRYIEVTLSQTIDSKNYTIKKKFYVRN
jgi:PKD repeat protein